MKEGIIVRGMKGYGLNKYIRVTIGSKVDNKNFIDALKKKLSK